MDKSDNRIFKNLILALVLVVTVFIAVVAWFTSKQESTANGITVTAISGEGLKASFDNASFDTAISRTITENFKFPLITGDGTNFFIPALNRASGVPLKDAAGIWQSKRDPIAARYGESGDYYVEDIWFSADQDLEVYLRQDSMLLPLDVDKSTGKQKDTIQRKSDFGTFSKDYIAGAARVAFFDVTEAKDPETGEKTETENLKYVWVPNENYQLTKSGNLTPIPSEIHQDGSGSFDPNDPDSTFGLSGLPDSGYRLWEGHTAAGQNPLLAAPQSRTVHIRENGTYVAAVDVVANTQVDHAILIAREDASINVNTAYTGAQEHDCYTYYNNDNITNAWVGAYFDGGKNINYSNPAINNEWSKLVVSSDNSLFFSSIDRFQVLVQCAFDGSGNVTELKVIGFVFYNSKNPGDIIGGAGDNPTGTTLPGYSIEDGNMVVITGGVSDTSNVAYGLTVGTSNVSSVRLSMEKDSNDVLVPVNPMPNQLFTVSNSNGVYTFKSLLNGKFLAIEKGKITTSNTASEFTLETKKAGTSTWPMLKSSDGYYITFNNGIFGVSATNEYAGLYIYQGSAYDFTDNGAKEGSYKYYKSGETALSTLTTAKTTDEAIEIPITRLVSSGESGGTTSYKSHIRVKIWVEGTDREAEMPLAGGIFSTNLRFNGKLKSS